MPASLQEVVSPLPALSPGCTIEGCVIRLSLFIVTLWRLDLRDRELFTFWNLWYEQIKQTFSDTIHWEQLGINPLGGRRGNQEKKMPSLNVKQVGREKRDYSDPHQPPCPQCLVCIS